MAGLLAGGIAWLTANTRAQDAQVKHTLEVSSQIDNVLILLQRVESAQRGYLLTGREPYLQPYGEAAAALPSSVERLDALVADNPAQQDNVARLRELVRGKLDELASTIVEVRAGNSNAALAIVGSDVGLRLMDQVRNLASAMKADAERLLTARQREAQTLGRLLQGGAIV